MENVKVKLSALNESACLSRSAVRVKLEISNNAHQDFYISSDAIMLDGFKGDKFHIVRVNGGADADVPYTGASINYRPKTVLLKAQEALSTELDLAAAYDFGSECGEYSISFQTFFSLCNDSAQTDCVGTEKSDHITVHIC